jgi:purine nucleoside phosphorylase
MTGLADKLQGRTPKTAVILGSALGSVVDMVEDPLVPMQSFPAFPFQRFRGMRANSS